MKLNLRRWKQKQSKILRKYRTVRLKFKRQRNSNFKGKFVLLLGNNKSRKSATVLKFLTNTLCEVKYVVPLTAVVRKHAPKRLTIHPRKHRQLLRKVKVVVPNKFKEKYSKAIKSARKNMLNWNKVKLDVEDLMMEKPKKVKCDEGREKIEKEKMKNEEIDNTPQLPVDDLMIEVKDVKVPTPPPVAKEAQSQVKPRKKVVPMREIPPITATVIDEKKQEFKVTYQSARLIKSPSPVASNCSISSQNSSNSTVAPSKISKCSKCKMRFTTQAECDGHENTCMIDADGSSSDDELHIDDDVELIVENDSVVVTVPTPYANSNNEEAPAVYYCTIDDCAQHFSSEEALLMHIGIEHDKSDRCLFTCEHCNVNFKRLAGLDAHRRLVHKANRASEVAKAQLHSLKFERFDTKSEFTCGVCSTKFNERSLLDRHFLACHVKKVYFCYKCHQKFSVDMIFNHLRQMHDKYKHELPYLRTFANVETVASWRCLFCIFTSKERIKVNFHMMNEHYGEFEIGDILVESSSPDSLEELTLPDNDEGEDLLIEILPKKPEETKKTSTEKKFRCARCQRAFSRSNGLRSHKCLKITNEELAMSDERLKPKKAPKNDECKFKCKVCKKKYKSSFNFRYHRCHTVWDPDVPESSDSDKSEDNSVKRKQPMVNGFFKCVKCPQVFTKRELQESHMKSAHEKTSETS